ncbi:uncharacterized protein LOC114662109 isoform X1 [Erpetoichthys calabaricus]|uniref:uncharacterized protein LOC114662109 isoform X1 n=2 Tax=Erpetoichthys calabaricus TaxID=27687 RepID=UPI0010A00C38|nr:uncharacterized protein LOC114662109 isoform X1 [Erpetoichthys calabaricus]XP_051790325.1 uncharacterized protein LOC114662109 isoform X1 [Erpetoichthys calabaricus]XP_051790326.1 uncharacterized protein LOC114662109 isoform X1 [Erpetoichthys calabaricus]
MDRCRDWRNQHVYKTLSWKLLQLEHLRTSLELDLRAFTHQVSGEVKTVLNDGKPDLHADYSTLLKTLDWEYLVIQQVSHFFQKIKTDVRPIIQLKLKPETEARSFYMPVFNSLSQGRRFLSRDNLMYGPKLCNTFLANTITNVAQILEDTVTFCHVQTSLGLPRECAKCWKPVTCQHKPQESQPCTVETNLPNIAKTKSPVKPKKTLPLQEPDCLQASSNFINDDFCKADQDNTSKHQSPDSLLDLSFLNETPINCQKLDSVGLISFFKNKKWSLTSDLKSHIFNTNVYGSPGKLTTENEEISSVGFKHNMDSCILTQQSKGQDNNTPSNQKSAFPVLCIKSKAENNTIVYHYLTATNTELWDVFELFLQNKNHLENGTATNTLQDVALPIVDCKVACSMSLRDQYCFPEIQGPLSHDSNFRKDDAEMCAFDDVHTKKNIPDFVIRRFAEMKVKVTYVNSPSCFFIQDVGTAFQDLSAQLNKECNVSNAQLKGVPYIGSFVCGWFAQDSLWCRASVIKICGLQGGNNPCKAHEDIPNVLVEVIRIDYGDCKYLQLRDLRPLDSQFFATPRQALCVSLEHVTPFNGLNWTSEAISWFKNIVAAKILYARLYSKESTVAVDLFMEKGKLCSMRRGPSISVRLTENGHALHSKMKNLYGSKARTVGTKSDLSLKREEKILSYYFQDC